MCARMVSTRPSIDDLSRQIRHLERLHVPGNRSWAGNTIRPGQDVVSSGVPELDALLPSGGFRTGTITEWLVPDRGCGASTLTLCLAVGCVRADQVLAIVDFAGDFHPLAAAAVGVDHRKTVVIRPTSKVDGFWALEQLLRSSAIGAVWCNLDRLQSTDCLSRTSTTDPSTNRSASAAKPRGNLTADNRLFRRLQLASESGDCVCFFVRPLSTRHEPSWADLRFLVRPSEHRESGTPSVNVELLRSRNSFADGRVSLRLPQASGLSEADRRFHSIESIGSHIWQLGERWA